MKASLKGLHIVQFCLKKVILQNDRAGNRIMNEELETGGEVSVIIKG